MPPEPASPERQRAILDAGVALFSRYGFRRTSMDLLAAEGGVAKATLYAYFDSKDALFRAVTGHVCDAMIAGAEAALEAEPELRGQVQGILRAKYGQLFELVHSQPHAAELLDSSNSLGADLVEEADARFAKVLRKALERASRAGAFDASGSSYVAIVETLQHAALGATHTASDAADHDRRLRDAVAVILRGF